MKSHGFLGNPPLLPLSFLFVRQKRIPIPYTPLQFSVIVNRTLFLINTISKFWARWNKNLNQCGNSIVIIMEISQRVYSSFSFTHYLHICFITWFFLFTDLDISLLQHGRKKWQLPPEFFLGREVCWLENYFGKHLGYKGRLWYPRADGTATQETRQRNFCCPRGWKVWRARGQKATCSVTSEILMKQHKKRLQRVYFFLRLCLNSATRFLGVRITM